LIKNSQNIQIGDADLERFVVEHKILNTFAMVVVGLVGGAVLPVGREGAYARAGAELQAEALWALRGQGG
jgi:hypothetical protein